MSGARSVDGFLQRVVGTRSRMRDEEASLLAMRSREDISTQQVLSLEAELCELQAAEAGANSALVQAQAILDDVFEHKQCLVIEQTNLREELATGHQRGLKLSADVLSAEVALHKETERRLASQSTLAACEARRAEMLSERDEFRLQHVSNVKLISRTLEQLETVQGELRHIHAVASATAI